MIQEYETVIGLEVHVELATNTKIFCGCKTAFGAKENTQVCPVCLGMPGTLPVLNKKVLEYAIAVGLATECEITKYSKFDRKNYFYPDNPQNYQISQLYLPICRNGFVEITTEEGNQKKIGIHEIHMEEDAGKLIHGENVSYVDYNRAGVPLIEIVSEPDMRNAKEVIAYLEKLRILIQYLGASDCKLQEGSMRADVNLSVRKVGDSCLGTRTEMKNLNSFHAITRAIEGETQRQIQLLKAGKNIVMETRRWDDSKKESYPMRSKEDSTDYRYFPDPDLVPVTVEDAWIDEIRGQQPEFRDAKRIRYQKEYGIPAYDIDIITEYRELAELFEQTSALCHQPKKVSNWLMGETLRLMREQEVDADQLVFSPENLAELIQLTDEGVINSTVAKEIFEVMFRENVNPATYVELHGLKTVSDDGALQKVVEEVIAANPQSVTDYRNGKERAVGFLVGQTMKAMKGKADPQKVNRLLMDILNQH